MAAARFPARSEPAKSQFFLPMAMGRIAFSTGLLCVQVSGTYGGGTGLPTQQECLNVLGCYGEGKVQKFAEIVAATVLCGEISLASAIVSDQWVSSHDKLGRNRP